MYVAFTEDQAREIRETGMSVVEFKRQMSDRLPKVLHSLYETIKKAWSDFIRLLHDAVNFITPEVKTMIDAVKNPEHRKYKFEKNVYKLKFDKYKMCVAMHHTWLARSNC